MQNGMRIVGVAAAVVVVLGFAWYATREDGGGGSAGIDAPLADAPPDAVDPGDLPAHDGSARETATDERDAVDDDVAERAGDAAAAPDEDAEMREVGGRVLDMQGRPVAGVTVRRPGGPRRAESDAVGRFTLAVAADSGFFGERRNAIVADDEDWATVFESAWFDGKERDEHLVVVAPAIELAGVVENPVGENPTRGSVSIDGMWDVGSRFPLPLDGNRAVEHRASIEEGGAFRFERAPSLPGETSLSLVASPAGFERGSIDLPTESRTDLVIEVTPEAVEVVEAPEEDGERYVSGVVLLPGGQPARGARVSWHYSSALVEHDGSFRILADGNAGRGLPLVAARDGYGPAILADVDDHVERSAPASPPPVTLRLGEDLAIEGVVLGADGEPARGWEVSLDDPTALRHGEIPVPQAEQLASGERSVTTKRDGEFRLHGLMDREYRIRAYDSNTLLRLMSDPVPAGTTNLVLRVPADAFVDVVRGSVVDRDGLPVEGVNVSVGLILDRSENGWSSTSRSDSTTTDEAGRFELRDVPNRHVDLQVSSDDVIPVRASIDDCDDPRAWTIEVARRCHVTVVAPDDVESGLRYSLQDEAGEDLMLTQFRSGSSSSTSAVGLDPGKNGVRSVSQDARRVVVRNKDREVVLEQEVWLDTTVVNEVVLDFP